MEEIQLNEIHMHVGSVTLMIQSRIGRSSTRCSNLSFGGDWKECEYCGRNVEEAESSGRDNDVKARTPRATIHRTLLPRRHSRYPFQETVHMKDMGAFAPDYHQSALTNDTPQMQNTH